MLKKSHFGMVFPWDFLLNLSTFMKMKHCDLEKDIRICSHFLTNFVVPIVS